MRRVPLIFLFMLVLPWTALTQTIDSMDWDDDSISDPLPPRTFTTDTSDRIPSELINLEVALDENGEDSVEVARICINLGNLYLSTGEKKSCTTGLGYFERAAQIYEDSVEGTSEELAEARLGVARAYVALDRFPDGESLLLDLTENASAPMSEVFGTLGELALKQNQLIQAESWLIKAAEMAIQLFENSGKIKDGETKDVTPVSSHVSRLAAFYERQFRPDDAAKWYRKNMELILPVLGPASSQAQDTFKKLKELIVEIMLISGDESPDPAAYGVSNPTHLALLYWGNDNNEKAEELLMRKIQLVMENREASYQKKAKAITDLADYYSALSQLEKAEKYYNTALSFSQKGSSLTRHLITLAKTVDFYYSNNKIPEGSNAIVKVISHTELVDRTHFSLVPLFTMLSRHYTLHEADMAKAEKYCLKALKIAEESFGKSHMETAFALEELGNLYISDQWQHKDYPSAMAAFQRALIIYDKTYGPVNREAGEDFGLLSKLSLVYKELKRDDEASILDQRIAMNKQASLDDITFDRPFDPVSLRPVSRFHLNTELKDNLFIVMREKPINIDGTTAVDAQSPSAGERTVSTTTVIPQYEFENWEKEFEEEYKREMNETADTIDWGLDDDEFEDLDDFTNLDNW